MDFQPDRAARQRFVSRLRAGMGAGLRQMAFIREELIEASFDSYDLIGSVQKAFGDLFEVRLLSPTEILLEARDKPSKVHAALTDPNSQERHLS